MNSKEYKKYHTNPQYLKILYKSVVDIHNIFVKHNILYYACGGTLIGAMRHKGIIPHDIDVDLCISDRDVKTLMSKEFKKKLHKLGYQIMYHKETKKPYDWLRILSYKKQGGGPADIDLFPVHLEKNKAGRYRTYFSPYVNSMWPREYAYLDELLPLKQVPFGNGVIIVPNKPKKILDRAVGKNWINTIVITQDLEHEDLDEPIIVKSKNFKPGLTLAPAKRQIILDKDDPILTGVGYGLLMI